MNTMSDPTTIETLVVKSDELVTALEATRRGKPTVLRVTAPFSARMRARLHVTQGDEARDSGQLLVQPGALVADDCPPLPHSDETAAKLRSRANEEYTPERHREVHESAIEAWRSRVPEYARSCAELAAVDTPVEVAILGE